MHLKISGSRICFTLFVIMAILNLLAVQIELPPLEYISKTLLISSLLWGFIQEQKIHPSIARWLALGLFMSWIGDVLLMLVEPYGEKFFVFGLGAFLVAHLFYISTFRSLAQMRGYHYVRRHPYSTLPFILFFVGLNYWWLDDLGNLRIPVVLYSAVISTMGIFALNLRTAISEKTFWVLIGGVLLFILSDTMIALNKFKFQVPYAPIAIMSTYISAQAAIVWAGLRLKLDNISVIQPPNGNK